MSCNQFTVGAGTDPVTTATCAEEGYYLGNKNGKFLIANLGVVTVRAFFSFPCILSISFIRPEFLDFLIFPMDNV